MADKKQERAALAAKMVAEQKAKQRRATLLRVAAVVGAMAVIIAVCVVVGIKGGGGGGDTAAKSFPAAGDAPMSLTVGDKSAPHTIVMYEDFLCPVCQAFEEAAGADLQKLADEGKVFLDYRPIHLLQPDYSAQAANAFQVVRQAAGDDVALKFHNLLYVCPDGDHSSTQCNQPSEGSPTKAPNGNDAVDNLVDLAVQAGANRADVEDGIRSDKFDAKGSWVSNATDEAFAAGIQGTPTIYLDGKEFTQGTTYAEVGENLVKAVS